MIDIHILRDASLLGTYAVAYIVIRHPSGIKQRLIASKSRFSKNKLRRARMNLVAALMVANLADNIRNTTKL